MNSKFKRFVSLTAAIIMVLGLLPSVVGAAETNVIKIEAESGAVSGGAVVTENDKASGDAAVNNIGANNGAGAVTLTVNMENACDATLNLYYITWSDRNFGVKVNDGAQVSIAAPGNGNSWTTPLTDPVSVEISLRAGTNTIVVSGVGDYAPNLDYIELILAEEATPPTTEATQPTTEPTQPTTEPTPPTTEATQPTTEPTQPTTEPTQPTTKPTEPQPAVPGGPIEVKLTKDEETVGTVMLASGQQQVYHVYNAGGKLMTVNDKDVVVMVNGVFYVPSNGVVEFMLPSDDPAVITLVNNGNTAEYYDMSFSTPLGSENNPDTLKLGRNKAALDARDEDGYTFEWIAEGDGLLTITMDDDINWAYVASNKTSGVVGERHTSAEDEIFVTEEIEVKKGDKVFVTVNTFDPDNEAYTPVGTVVFDAEFEEGGKKCYVKRFRDVNLDGWYHEPLDYMVGNGYMNGKSATVMDPDGVLTRAELVQILYKLIGSPGVSGKTEPFDDVESQHWFYNAVVWAYSEGVVNGTSAKAFSPDATITREQLATILYRYNKSPKVSGNLNAYADGNKVNDYAVDAMLWAVQNGLVNGIKEGGKTLLAPRPMSADDANGNATRAQAATILARYLQK